MRVRIPSAHVAKDKGNKPTRKESKEALEKIFKETRKDIDSEPYIKPNPAKGR